MTFHSSIGHGAELRLLMSNEHVSSHFDYGATHGGSSILFSLNHNQMRYKRAIVLVSERLIHTSDWHRIESDRRRRNTLNGNCKNLVVELATRAGRSERSTGFGMDCQVGQQLGCARFTGIPLLRHISLASHYDG